MSNIIDYKVHLDFDFDAIAKKVKDDLKLGWEPIGGISVAEDGLLCQAMIRKSGEKE